MIQERRAGTQFDRLQSGLKITIRIMLVGLLITENSRVFELGAQRRENFNASASVR